MSRLIWFLLLLTNAVPIAAQERGGRLGGTVSPTHLAPNDKTPKVISRPNEGAQPLGKERSATNSPQPQTVFGNTKSTPPPKAPAPRPARPADNVSSRPATYAPPPTGHLNAKGNSHTPSANKAKSVTNEPIAIQWMTIEQALEKSKTEKKKIFVDLYTDWCRWCKYMDSTTFVNPNIAIYLNEHYYPVKFNAEQEHDIVFKDKTYKFKKGRPKGYHELAGFWLNNKLSFPTIVFLDENQQVLQSIAGYQEVRKMEAIITYFGSDSHKKIPWESYEKNFEATNKR